MCKLTVRIIINTNGYNCIHHHTHLTRVWYTRECSSRYFVHTPDESGYPDPSSCILHPYRIRSISVMTPCVLRTVQRPICMGRDDLPSNDKRIYLMLILLQYGSLSHTECQLSSKACLLQLSPGHPTWILQHNTPYICICTSTRTPSLVGLLRSAHPYGACMYVINTSIHLSAWKSLGRSWKWGPPMALCGLWLATAGGRRVLASVAYHFTYPPRVSRTVWELRVLRGGKKYSIVSYWQNHCERLLGRLLGKLQGIIGRSEWKKKRTKGNG